MKILNVVVQAFGSYRGTVVFPMEELGSEGLYLIHGNTGSGKTTLFDAICFALFQTASGKNREPLEFRCDHSDKKVETKVELTFEVYGKKYLIVRYYPMKRSGEMNSTVNVKLTKLDMHLDDPLRTVEGAKDVKNYLKELLKVEREQFSRIAMIAQGEFQEVLLAKTKERVEIFRKLFSTEPYREMQEKIKNDYTAVETEESEISAKVNDCLGRIDSFGGENEEELAQIHKLKEEGGLRSDAPEELKAIKTTQEGYQVQVNQSLDKTEKELEKVNASLVEMKQKEGLVQQREEAEKGLEQEKKSLELAKIEVENTKNYPKEVEQLNVQLTKVQEKKELCQKVEDQEKILKTLETQLEQLKKDGKIHLQEKETQEKDLETVKTWLEEQSDLGERTMALRHSVEEARSQEKDWVSLEKQLKEVETKEKSYIKVKTEYDKASGAWEEQAEALKQATKTFLDEQAGVLASELVEDEPCSVCGSREHPNPAKAKKSTCTSEELEELRRLSEEKSDEAKHLSEKAGEAKGDLNTLMGAVVATSVSLFHCEDVEKIPSILKEKREKSTLKEDEIQLKQLENTELQKKGREEERSKLEENLAKTKQEIDENALDTREKEVEFSEKNKIFLEETLKLEGHTVNSLSLEEKALEKDKTEKETQRGERLKQLQDAEVAVASWEGALKNLEDTPDKDDLFKEKEAAADKQSQLSREKSSLQKQKTNLAVALANNEKILLELKDLVEREAVVTKKKNWLKPLREVILGKGDVILKTGFEAYVQQYYFDLVLKEANVVYSRITNGAYVMMRDDTSKKSSEVGLDVKILDVASGKIRLARSLSGGESFQASLALALGFSQAVAQQSNAAPIQSIFLDEGFGSLDGDSLQEAIGTLLGLAQEGQVVGIISHVEELKNSISKQILVEKTTTGSKVTFPKKVIK